MLIVAVVTSVRAHCCCCDLPAGQLEEERQVTANLSKNLELERRKVESMEQKAKVVIF